MLKGYGLQPHYTLVNTAPPVIGGIGCTAFRKATRLDKKPAVANIA